MPVAKMMFMFAGVEPLASRRRTSRFTIWPHPLCRVASGTTIKTLSPGITISSRGAESIGSSRALPISRSVKGWISAEVCRTSKTLSSYSNAIEFRPYLRSICGIYSLLSDTGLKLCRRCRLETSCSGRAKIKCFSFIVSGFHLDSQMINPKRIMERRSNGSQQRCMPAAPGMGPKQVRRL